MRRVLLVLVVAIAGVVLLPTWVRLFGGPAAAAAVPPPAGRVEIGNGLTLNVQELGAGTPVVLVHGLPSNIGDWGVVPERLAAAGHRVVVYDRIGYGWSSRTDPEAPGSYTLAASADHLGALLDRLGLARATLVGWSYGGGVVQQYAVGHPDRVERLVLLGSVGPRIALEPGDWLGQVARSPLGPPLFHWVTGVPALARPVVAGALEGAFSGAGAIPADWIDRTEAQLAMPGTIDAWLAEERHEGYAALEPGAIAAPTLVLHGDDDRLVPVRVAEDLAEELPNAELVLVAHGSHMLPATHPDLVAARVHAWATGP